MAGRIRHSVTMYSCVNFDFVTKSNSARSLLSFKQPQKSGRLVLYSIDIINHIDLFRFYLYFCRKNIKSIQISDTFCFLRVHIHDTQKIRLQLFHYCLQFNGKQTDFMLILTSLISFCVALASTICHSQCVNINRFSRLNRLQHAIGNPKLGSTIHLKHTKSVGNRILFSM